MSGEDPLAGLFDRDEILGGLPAKRAQTLLYLIESRTAQLVAQSKRAMQRYVPEEAAEERESAFLEAFAVGREPPIRPSVQDLERHSEAWAPLVARNPRVQAALAHALVDRHRLVRADVPGIRAALGLDDAAVQEAYERLYRQPLRSIYSTPTSLDRLRWIRARVAHRLETLPPFFTAYALTLTETVGATILALPIALATLGPIAGVVILVVLGLVNVFTVALMSESLSRSGTIRYGHAYIGRAVLDYLGRLGSGVLSVSVFAFCFLAVMVFYIGFSTTLDDATGVPDLVWVGLLFAIGLFYVRRGSLNATIASALVVGAVNIALILLLSLLGLTHLDVANLTYDEHVPFLHGNAFERSVIGLVFGVVLAAYFGHLSVANCGRIVLRRDPTSRSLVWGTVAAQLTAILLYSLFVLAVNGAVSPRLLEGQEGTAIGPLADEVGSVVLVLGTIFAVLGMGMASIHPSLGLSHIVHEWLPVDVRRVIALPRRRGRLLLSEPRDGDLRAGIVYLGLEDGEARFAVDIRADGRTRRVETAIVRGTELAELAERGLKLELETLEADRQLARVRVVTNMRIAYEAAADRGGVPVESLLRLADPDAELLAWMMRTGETTPAEADQVLGPGTAARLSALAERGVVAESVRDGERRYRARPGARRGGRLPQEIWNAIAGESEPAGREPPRGRSHWLRNALASARGRALVGVAPLVAAFALTEWLLATGSGSFSGLLSFLGVLLIALLGGVFPVLLLISSRRRGDYVPGRIYRRLGNRFPLAFVYVFALAAILLHGLVIWEEPAQRIGALLVGALVIGLSIFLVRRGAFARRGTVELRAEELGDARVSVVAAGRPVAASVELEGPPSSPRRVRVASDWDGARLAEIKVWAHRVDAADDSHALPAQLHLEVGGERIERDLSLGQVVLPVPAGPAQLELALDDATGR